MFIANGMILTQLLSFLLFLWNLSLNLQPALLKACPLLSALITTIESLIASHCQLQSPQKLIAYSHQLLDEYLLQ